MPKFTLQKAFGSLVRQHRLKKGLSQEKLAERAELDRTYISGIERGIRNPSLTALVRLSTALSISISELVHGLEREVEQP